MPTKVRNFDVEVQFSCFDAAGAQISSARRDDLAPGFFGGLKVDKKGRFSGTSATPTGLTYSGSGRLNKGRANGILQITQGSKGTAGYCSTGTLANPEVQWTAKLIPPACGAAEPLARRCATPTG